MKIALVSLNQSWEDKTANQIKCIEYIEQASKSEVEIIVFPEMTLTGFTMNAKFVRENPIASETLGFFSRCAREYKISIIFGVVFEKEDKSTNNLVVVDNNGNLLSTYSKIHPFSFSGENEFYVGGSELVKTKISDALIGLTICYDLRFPEIYQALSKDCNLIVTIANWPEKRVEHWNSLLQARAIENQSFVVGVNRTGIDGLNLKYAKSSFVFDPVGKKMQAIQTFQDMDIYTLSLGECQSFRDSFPIKQDRKIEFYKSII